MIFLTPPQLENVSPAEKVCFRNFPAVFSMSDGVVSGEEGLFQEPNISNMPIGSLYETGNPHLILVHDFHATEFCFRALKPTVALKFK